MNRISKLFVAIALVFTLVPRSEISALDSEKMIEEELKVAIISGDGSAENPYQVDYDKAPYFKEYMDDVNEKVMTELQGIDNSDGVSTCGIYDSILIGTKYTNQTYGGEWEYTSGAPSTTYNGNIWMKKVVYLSVTKTKGTYEVLSDKFLYGIITSHFQDAVKRGFDDAVKYLVAKGLGESAAKSFLTAAGRFNNLMTAAEALKFVSDIFELQMYKNAVEKGYGMINATYSTSYNGSWYAHYGEDTWTTAPTVYLPSTYYGTGTYTKYTK